MNLDKHLSVEAQADEALVGKLVIAIILVVPSILWKAFVSYKIYELYAHPDWPRLGIGPFIVLSMLVVMYAPFSESKPSAVREWKLGGSFARAMTIPLFLWGLAIVVHATAVYFRWWS